MHQNFIRGRCLILIFKDGHQELGKFRKAERGIIYFYDRDPVKMDKINSAGYYKPQSYTLLSKGETKL